MNTLTARVALTAATTLATAGLAVGADAATPPVQAPGPGVDLVDVAVVSTPGWEVEGAFAPDPVTLPPGGEGEAVYTLTVTPGAEGVLEEVASFTLATTPGVDWGEVRVLSPAGPVDVAGCDHGTGSMICHLQWWEPAWEQPDMDSAGGWVFSGSPLPMADAFPLTIEVDYEGGTVRRTYDSPDGIETSVDPAKWGQPRSAVLLHVQEESFVSALPLHEEDWASWTDMPLVWDPASGESFETFSYTWTQPVTAPSTPGQCQRQAPPQVSFQTETGEFFPGRQSVPGVQVCADSDAQPGQVPVLGSALVGTDDTPDWSLSLAPLVSPVQVEAGHEAEVDLSLTVDASPSPWYLSWVLIGVEDVPGAVIDYEKVSLLGPEDEDMGAVCSGLAGDSIRCVWQGRGPVWESLDGAAQIGHITAVVPYTFEGEAAQLRETFDSGSVGVIAPPYPGGRPSHFTTLTSNLPELSREYARDVPGFGSQVGPGIYLDADSDPVWLERGYYPVPSTFDVAVTFDTSALPPGECSSWPYQFELGGGAYAETGGEITVCALEEGSGGAGTVSPTDPASTSGAGGAPSGEADGTPSATPGASGEGLSTTGADLSIVWVGLALLGAAGTIAAARRFNAKSQER